MRFYHLQKRIAIDLDIVGAERPYARFTIAGTDESYYTPQILGECQEDVVARASAWATTEGFVLDRPAVFNKPKKPAVSVA